MAFAKERSRMETLGMRRAGRGALIGILVGIVLLWILKPWVTVPVGERAVVFSLSGGTRTGQLGEGTHLLVPFIQRAVFYDVRTQTYTMSGVSWEGEIKGDDTLKVLTSDGQEVRIDVSVRFHLDRDRVSQLHQKVGLDYINKIIRPTVRSVTRVVIAEFPVNDVFAARRELIEQRMADKLRAELKKHDILLDEVLLRNVQFSEAFAQAIENKQIAQQNDQRMLYVLQKAEKEKQQKILEAQGDARSIQLRGQAIAQNQRVVQYEYARKIAPNVGTIITDGRNASVPFAGAPGAR
jgi:regulator of protease activity HflC (stomatin/prohibitin superfamily)